MLMFKPPISLLISPFSLGDPNATIFSSFFYSNSVSSLKTMLLQPCDGILNGIIPFYIGSLLQNKQHLFQTMFILQG